VSLEFMDGFDHYNNSTNLQRKWNAGSVGITGTQTGRFGVGRAIQMWSVNGVNWITLSSVATRVMGFAFQMSGTYTNWYFAQFRDSGTVQCGLQIDSSGHIMVMTGGSVNGSTTLATSTNTLAANTWYYIEFKVTIGSSGSYQVNVGGVNWVSGTGNTQITANATTNEVAFYQNSSVQLAYDDLYILNTSGSVNNNFLGDSRIYTSLPSGDDASFKQWTPSAGTNHYANVSDNPPDDDTSYNSSGTVGQIDLFTYPSISPAGVIAGVQTVLTAKIDAAGTRTACEECRSSGTNYDGSNSFTLTTSYQMYRQIRETNPATSAAWTSSGVNAAEFGAKVLT